MIKNEFIYAAHLLFDARINKKPLKNLPKALIPKNIKDAYRIQDELCSLYLKKNNKIIGKKIGCTSKKAQKQINITEPFYGNIFSKFYSKSKIILNNKNFINSYFEPEFSFKIKKNINNKIINKHNINQYIESVLPSIEIVDARYKNWKKVGINNLIADNGANSFWIRGKEFKNISYSDFNNFEVKVYVNNKLVETGNSKNVLKNPMNAIIWLNKKLSSKNKKIQKGEYISTGTCTPAILLKKNDKINVDFDFLGKVEFQFI